MSLRSQNLNLIPVLRALLHEKSVSKVAKSLGTTQPAVSGALARLRVSLDDPLLVRVGRGMELTTYAQRLLPELDQVCEALEGIWIKPVFDPQFGQRSFRIASPDYGPMLIGTPMINAMRDLAPEVSIIFSNLSTDSIRTLKSGRLDFLLSSRGWLTRTGANELKTMRLFDDEFVAIVAPGHPLATIKNPTAADFASQTYIIFDPDFDTVNDRSNVSAHDHLVLEGLGFAGHERIVTRVKQFGVLPLMAAQTGCVALAPLRVVEANRRSLPIRILDRRFPKTRFEVCLSWSKVQSFDPSHRWFRDLMENTLLEQSQLVVF